MTRPLSFSENSKKIAQHFLQSVVAVDDNIKFESRPTVDNYELIEPDGSGFGNLDFDEGQPSGPLPNNLYYQDLSHEFAKKGIICGGFSPKQGDLEASLTAVVNTSKNADITILDWQMDPAEYDGKFATDIIRRISEIDLSEGGRTRLVCIYTAKDTEDVANTLEDSLKHLEPKLNRCTMKFNLPNLTHWKIEVVDKGDVQESGLCDFLVDSFTELTAGLLSNAALASIASIRDNTHNLLHKFNSELDTAYLSHVLGLISSPAMREQANEVAFDYAVELISEELKSSLQINEKVKASLAKEVILCWPEFIEKDENKESFFLELSDGESLSFHRGYMKELLLADTLKDTLDRIGMKSSKKTFIAEPHTRAKLAEETNLNNIEPLLNENGAIQVKEKTLKPLQRFEKLAIQLSIENPSDVPLLDLCSIENTRRNQNTTLAKSPSLKQGTIIKNTDVNSYFLCIQPLCDSVRLKTETSFTFLEIKEVTTSKGKFSHVIKKADNTHLKLLISCKATTVRTLNFMPDPESKIVLSNLENDYYFFQEIQNGTSFKWYGELKQAVTQAIVNNLAAQISRVGNDSFEWLRQKQS